jgi:hypothetical protein
VVQFVLCKRCEQSITRVFLHARRAEEKCRRMMAMAHLAPEPDFGVFLAPLWLVLPPCKLPRLGILQKARRGAGLGVMRGGGDSPSSSAFLQLVGVVGRGRCGRAAAAMGQGGWTWSHEIRVLMVPDLKTPPILRSGTVEIGAHSQSL